jgi:GNAT superfamily N-acetyltransferase
MRPRILKQAEQWPWRVAMADTAPWQNRITHYPWPDGTGTYAIMNGQGDDLGSLQYRHVKGTEQPETFIDHIETHPDYQGQGIAQSLMERLHQDHPDHKINPGRTTQDGAEFTQRLLDENPEHRDLLTDRHWAPGWTP